MMSRTMSRVLTISLLAAPLALFAWMAIPAAAEDEAHERFRKRVVRDRGESAEKARDRDRKGDKEGEGGKKERDRDRDGEGKERKGEGEGKRESEEGRFLKQLAKAKVGLAEAITLAEKASGGKAVAARYVIRIQNRFRAQLGLCSGCALARGVR